MREDAKAVMHRNPVVLPSTATLSALIEGLAQSGVGSVLITEGGKVVGIFTERDLVHALAKGVKRTEKAAKLMNHLLETVTPETPLAECARLMEERQCRHLPVVGRDGVPVGTVTILATQKAGLARLSEMTAKLALRDEYLGIVAHDVRSPLSVIESCCLFLMQDSDPTALTAMLETMHKSAQSGIRLVEELLDVGRLNSGAKLQRMLIDLSQLATEIAAGLKPVAAQRRLSVKTRIQPGIKVTADASRLGQAFDNLVNNALKFTPEGRGITVSLELAGATARLAVHDEGAGIPADKLERLFKKHERLDADVVGTKGFGLGLAIAHQFVALHKGQIEVDGGGGGKGAIFTIVLPGASVDAKVQGGSEGKPRVLVVDDDDDVRHYLKTALGRAGYDVSMTPDGPSCLAELHRINPHVVITDARMPGVDGLTLVRRLKQQRPELPVILLSGYLPTLDESQATGLFRADRYLTKPVDLDTLLEAVRTCATRSAA